MQEQGKEGLFVIWIAAGHDQDVGLRINEALPPADSTVCRSYYFEVPPGSRDVYDELVLLTGAMTDADEATEAVRVVVDKLVYYELEGATRTYWNAVAEVDLLKLEAEHQMQIQLANGAIAGKNDDDRWGAYWQSNDEDMRALEAAQELKGKARSELEAVKAKVRLLGYMQAATWPPAATTWDAETETYDDGPH